MNENYYLCNLALVKRYRQQAGNVRAYDADDDALLMMFIESASNYFISELERVPLPYTQTRTYDFTTDNLTLGASRLWVHDDIRSVTTITNGDGTALTAFTLGRADGRSGPPYDYIQLAPPNHFRYNGIDPFNAITVLGEWGYTTPNPIVATTTLAGVLNTTATTFSVVSAAAISAGDYVRVGAESMLVTAAATNVLTVVRAVLGTTAATHDNGAVVSRITIMSEITIAVADMASYLLKAKDRIGENMQIYEGGIAQVFGLSPITQRTYKKHRKYQL